MIPLLGPLTCRGVARAAVYTAIFGGYDRLWGCIPNADTDFFCFTDDPSLEAPPWQIVPSPARYEHPRMSAKWFKMHPHLALPDHRRTIWIDGSIKVRSDSFAEEILRWLGDSGIALVRHPDRDDVFEEAEASIKMTRYRGQPIREQVEHYRAEGFRSDNGLYIGGVIARDSDDESVRRLNEAWMEENLRWSFQDQLSLPYLLWRFGIKPAVIPLAQRDNPFFRRIGHRRPD
jgi:hypothetical protein